MKKWWTLVGVLLVIIITGTVALVVIPAPTAKAPTNTTASTTEASLADLIVVDTPQAGAKIGVGSPLKITGKARGNWYFEASFPVEVYARTEVSDVLVGKGIAQAQGDWMTTDFVPFIASITYTSKPTPTMQGFIVLKNDNPSGDPAKQKELDVPVTF